MTILTHTDEGLRVVLAEDWFIYVVRESDNLMFQYVTECWPEWADVDPAGLGCSDHLTVHAMIPFAHKHIPSPVRRDCGEHMTLEQFNANAF